MPAVDLDANEWGQVMAILATAPWRDANPLLMKIGNQLRTAPQFPAPGNTAQPEGNGKEVGHE